MQGGKLRLQSPRGENGLLEGGVERESRCPARTNVGRRKRKSGKNGRDGEGDSMYHRRKKGVRGEHFLSLKRGESRSQKNERRKKKAASGGVTMQKEPARLPRKKGGTLEEVQTSPEKVYT